MSNLLDSIKGYVTPELINQTAQTLGENESGIGKAIGGWVPIILAGMLNKTTDSAEMGNIFNLISSIKPATLDHLSGLAGSSNLAHDDPKDTAGHLLSHLFGSKVPAIINALSSFSGIKNSSASSLLGLAGPLVMGFLSKQINTQGLNVSGLANLLRGERDNIMGMLPTGLSPLLGLTNWSNSTVSTATNIPATGMRWLWPLLLLLGSGGGILMYMKNCATKVEAPKVEVVAPVSAPAPAPIAPAQFTMKLSTGYEVVGNPTGIEAALLRFIQAPDSMPSKTNWFDFDHLLFQTASDQLDLTQSKVQLANVFEILKAYPKVKIKIGGYTDNVGDAKQNKVLSDRRAKNVMAELVGLGIEKNRLEAEGYGQDHPVASNDTEAGRAKNRRVSVSVRAK